MYESAEARNGLLLSSTQRLWNVALDLLFPPRCVGCGRVDYVWCERCQAEINAIPFQTDINTLEPLTASAATGIHEGKLREAVQALKYENVRAIASPLGERLSNCLAQLKWTIDIIVPVPLHMSRLKERGYNQAQVLGAHVANRHSIPLVPDAITRWRSTNSQVGLTAAERKLNVEGAFTANRERVNQRTILLIDDVFTTGSTLKACAQAALDAGAAAAYSLTVTVARN
ncbi:MAG TPA: ComF family protein [Oceanobacillus sp.]|nr:ComF family protein [Oceanobacillus sp.]